MNLMRWDPFHDTADIFQRFNHLLGRNAGNGEPAVGADWRPTANITESEHEYRIKAELPEVRKEDIQIELNGDMLSIRGERKIDNELKDDKVHRIESFYGSFARSFRLPEDVDTDAIKAESRDGVLTIHLPKTKASTPRTVKVEVG